MGPGQGQSIGTKAGPNFLNVNNTHMLSSAYATNTSLGAELFKGFKSTQSIPIMGNAGSKS